MNHPIKQNKYPFTEKPWGYEKLIVLNDRYALKEIFLRKGCRSSLQSHFKKEETIYVLSGELELETKILNNRVNKERYIKGESYSIDKNMIHRVTAIQD